MRGYQVTLTTALTAYNLYTLVTAIDANFVDGDDVDIQIDDNGGAQKVYIGDSNVSTSRYAWKGTIGDSSPHYDFVQGLYATSDTNSVKLNISVGRRARR